jgi:hypothetical protein
MVLAVTAVAGLPLFIASLVCVLLLPAGLGVVLAPKSLLAVRRQAGLQRRRALEWSGVTIATPYRSRSARPANRVFRRCRWVLGDPATWRDLLWTLVNVPVSVVLGLLPAFLLVAGTWSVVDDFGTLLFGWAHVAPHGFLPQVFFLAMLPGCVIAGPWLLKTHAVAASWLLAPTRKEMAVHTVAAGGTAIDPEVVSQLLARHDRDGQLGRLTSRERGGTRADG